MYSARVRSAYQQTEAKAKIHPVKLIHLMYERVLTHLKLAEEGLLKSDIQARGENLSKAIAIVSELNASIKDNDNSGAAGFLRGLYSAILVELPKVAVSNDVSVIRQSCRYIERLKEIWEETAMAEADLNNEKQGAAAPKRDGEIEVPEQPSSKGAGKPAGSRSYGGVGSSKIYGQQGLSVAI